MKSIIFTYQNTEYRIEDFEMDISAHDDYYVNSAYVTDLNGNDMSGNVVIGHLVEQAAMDYLEKHCTDLLYDRVIDYYAGMADALYDRWRDGE
jgi:hypothetical protein